ncbi:MAG: hypothetical protein WBQ45_18245 [Roseiarcus sp.]|jgi:hypothetical protein|uniref:hypothetical protein n=1 Tax=Roseiarcus sp. TaxID=1969460 RepID=UPI003BB0458D
MKHIMRQTRDGVVEHIDPSPPNPSDGALSVAIASVGWETALLWYMRTLAWVWVSKGLFNWAIVLGAFPRLGDFTTMALPLQATIVAFACFNLLAAVGLWLAAPWGGAIWLLCAMVESASPFLSPRAASISYGGAMLNVVLVVGYFFLSWRAVRARD